MKNLTLLDKVNEFLDNKRFLKVLNFICFVVAPVYIVGHIIVAFIQGRI